MVKHKKIVILIILVVITQHYFSQPGPGGGPPCWPPPCIPIDGGISIFVAIAAIVGYKFSSKSKN